MQVLLQVLESRAGLAAPAHAGRTAAQPRAPDVHFADVLSERCAPLDEQAAETQTEVPGEEGPSPEISVEDTAVEEAAEDSQDTAVPVNTAVALAVLVPEVAVSLPVSSDAVVSDAPVRTEGVLVEAVASPAASPGVAEMPAGQVAVVVGIGVDVSPNSESNPVFPEAAAFLEGELAAGNPGAGEVPAGQVAVVAGVGVDLLPNSESNPVFPEAAAFLEGELAAGNPGASEVPAGQVAVVAGVGVDLLPNSESNPVFPEAAAFLEGELAAGNPGQASHGAADLATEGSGGVAVKGPVARDATVVARDATVAVPLVDADGGPGSIRTAGTAGLVDRNLESMALTQRLVEPEPAGGNALESRALLLGSLVSREGQADPEAEVWLEGLAARPAGRPGTAPDAREAGGKTFAEAFSLGPEGSAAEADSSVQAAALSGAGRDGPEQARETPVLKTLSVQTVKSIRYLISKGGKTITVRLVPESLGEMRIEVNSTGDELAVRLVSANPAVRHILEAQANHLRDALARQGVEVGKVEIASTMSQGAGGQPRPETAAQDSMPRPNSLADAAQPSGKQEPGLRRVAAARHDGTLNVFV